MLRLMLFGLYTDTNDRPDYGQWEDLGIGLKKLDMIGYRFLFQSCHNEKEKTL